MTSSSSAVVLPASELTLTERDRDFGVSNPEATGWRRFDVETSPTLSGRFSLLAACCFGRIGRRGQLADVGLHFVCNHVRVIGRFFLVQPIDDFVGDFVQEVTERDRTDVR